MDIDPDVFWNLTMREFQLKQRGYLERLEDEQILQKKTRIKKKRK